MDFVLLIHGRLNLNKGNIGFVLYDQSIQDGLINYIFYAIIKRIERKKHGMETFCS